ncbi:CBS domain-containing protein [Vreelandella massiliensis]|uniref:CBS domain-containing protein n=1 Tax=Vreelandella massiliensis TaxID=1816686 RepID=UPI00096AB537|nr:CBS domain-containing protein [Halomonas massiliensis]MYL23149.1 CBS domain-containing protein [Halomonas alkaliantarctica]
MQAADIMTHDVISVGPEEDVNAIAKLLLTHHISAVPVVDDAQKVLGIVSEGDLMRRVKSEEGEERSWWLSLFAGQKNATEYVKSHGRKASEVMTPDPLTIDESTPLHKIARLLEKHRIKRVPVVSDGKLVGIVSRANLLQGLASSEVTTGEAPGDDRAIREAILKEVEENTGVRVAGISVIVSEGVAELWGLVESNEQRKAVQVAAENTPGVTKVENNLGLVPKGVGGY